MINTVVDSRGMINDLPLFALVKVSTIDHGELHPFVNVMSGQTALSRVVNVDRRPVPVPDIPDLLLGIRMVG
jgi:hypothetical protein